MWWLVQTLCQLILVMWASPNSGLGLLVGGLGLLSGGRVRWREGCVEFWGGGVTWLLKQFPIRPIAMTLGHVVLGIHAEALVQAGTHERIHVRQYERWGPMFLPAYGLASLWAWYRGGNAYLDNPFEVEAYRDAPRRR